MFKQSIFKSHSTLINCRWCKCLGDIYYLFLLHKIFSHLSRLDIDPLFPEWISMFTLMWAGSFLCCVCVCVWAGLPLHSCVWGMAKAKGVRVIPPFLLWQCLDIVRDPEHSINLQIGDQTQLYNTNLGNWGKHVWSQLAHLATTVCECFPLCTCTLCGCIWPWCVLPNEGSYIQK